LARVARESVIDLAADGVVYAESRYAPEQHLQSGLTLQQVVDAVQTGLDEGMDDAEAAGRPIRVQAVLCAMRQANHSERIAELALANRDRGVVGFDIAGPERGFPPTQHRRAFAKLREANFPYTIHAGESADLESLWQAVQQCGAVRIGHGAQIAEDIEGWQVPETAVLGRLAHWVRDRHLPLEVCPTSNLQTGLAPDIASHPITALKRLGFAVTVNTDNRLMSGTSMTREAGLLIAEAGWTLADLRDVTATAMRAAFIHDDEREDLLASVILPAYAAVV
jgi:adenosine deaminase